MRAPNPLRHVAHMTVELPLGVAVLCFLLSIGLLEFSEVVTRVVFSAPPTFVSAPPDVRARAELAGRLTGGIIGSVLMTVWLMLWGRRLHATDLGAPTGARVGRRPTGSADAGAGTRTARPNRAAG